MHTLNTSKEDTTIYFIPGLGADHRLFANIEIDPAYTIKYIEYSVPKKGASLKSYARELATQIDTSKKFVLIGVSIGGMLATELSEFLYPEKVIIISSAKCRKELPGRYRFQRRFPLYKTVPKKLVKLGSFLLQPLVEPDSKKEKEVFRNMLKAKDPLYMARSVEMILKWKRKEYNKDIVHIHGNKDRTLPIRNVSYDYLVESGSHVMTLTRGEEISEIISGILRKSALSI